MARNFNFSIGEFYHVYNRGTDKRTIFLEENDYQRFFKLLYLCNSTKNIVFRDIPIGLAYGYEKGETLVDIGAYCLMPNHFHLLIHEKIEGGCSLFMQKLATAYSMYFNTKYERSGGLFEGPFRAKHIDNDEYFKYLFAYVHLNPVKIFDSKWKEDGIADRQGAQDFLNKYVYSSYFDWQGKERPESKIVNRLAMPEYFTTAKDFDAYVNDWLTFNLHT